LGQIDFWRLNGDDICISYIELALPVSFQNFWHENLAVMNFLFPVPKTFEFLAVLRKPMSLLWSVDWSESFEVRCNVWGCRVWFTVESICTSTCIMLPGNTVYDTNGSLYVNIWNQDWKWNFELCLLSISWYSIIMFYGIAMLEGNAKQIGYFKISI
jgi:hypothetical protein